MKKVNMTIKAEIKKPYIEIEQEGLGKTDNIFMPLEDFKELIKKAEEKGKAKQEYFSVDFTEHEKRVLEKIEFNINAEPNESQEEYLANLKARDKLNLCLNEK